jgi:prepilin-type processing-associated H-X9-DG protein
MKRKRARGLTLIELLVVIAVFILLAMLFFPWGDGTLREKVRQTACLSNLKQIGRAASMYGQDYDGTLPWNPSPGGLPASHWAPPFRAADCAAQPGTSFVTLLQPYTRTNYPVFRCPGYPGYPAGRHLGYAKSLNPARANKIGYGFNTTLIGSPCRPRTLASLGGDQAAIILFGEADQPWAASTWVNEGGQWTHYWSVDPVGPERHGHGQNFAYADGHARFLRPLLTGSDPDKKTRSGYYPQARLE